VPRAQVDEIAKIFPFDPQNEGGQLTKPYVLATAGGTNAKLVYGGHVRSSGGPVLSISIHGGGSKPRLPPGGHEG
jgi:hypothetical protein